MHAPGLRGQAHITGLREKEEERDPSVPISWTDIKVSIRTKYGSVLVAMVSTSVESLCAKQRDLHLRNAVCIYCS